LAREVRAAFGRRKLYVPLAQLAAIGLEGVYDLSHLQEFHRLIFQDVTPGRESCAPSLAKPGSMFALPEHIESYVTEVLRQLAAERHLRGLPREQLAERLVAGHPPAPPAEWEAVVMGETARRANHVLMVAMPLDLA
jgi:hypothetical protein